ncbi:hypothetical protein LV78_005260 [Actinosynnema pretiosum]|nr:hypothetical protein [Actinosynnema pretiosum]
MDQQDGSRLVHDRVAAFVHDNIRLATCAGHDAELPCRVCSLLAQALGLARHGGDRAYAANLLPHTARLTITQGERLPAGQAVDHARHAVGLARIGHTAAGAQATPGLRALLHLTTARGHALLGDRTEAGHDPEENLRGRCKRLLLHRRQACGGRLHRDRARSCFPCGTGSGIALVDHSRGKRAQLEPFIAP